MSVLPRILAVTAAVWLLAACASPSASPVVPTPSSGVDGPPSASPTASVPSPHATGAAPTEGVSPTESSGASATRAPSPTVQPSGGSPGASPGTGGLPTLNDATMAVAGAVTGFDQPTGIAAIGEGDHLVIEKATGHVRRVQGDRVGAEPVIDLAVNSFDERGLLGIELHPDFASNGYVYLYWTARDDAAVPDSLLGDDTEEPTEVPELGNRVDRFTWDGSALTWDREIVRLRSNTLDTDTSDRIRGNHDAGPLEFGPDGKLYVQNGDQNLRGQLQNIADGPAPDDANLTGIILRLNDDGSVPEDNPFAAHGSELGGEAGENVGMIWAYGIRNSFGLRFHPETGDLWQTENGDDSWDEINRFAAGANSGWIQVMGPPDRFPEYREIEVDSEDGLDNPDFPPDLLADSVDEALTRMFALDGSAYSPPVFAWRYPPAVTALEFVIGDELGASSANSIFLGTVLTDTLLRYPLADDGAGLALEGGLADGIDDNSAKGDIGESAEYVVGTGFGVVTDILLGPDGLLYVVSLSNGAVYALGPSEGTPPSPPASAGVSPEASPAASAAESPAASAAESPAGSPAGSAAATEVLIQTDRGTANEFVPAEAEVSAGEQVSLTFENIAQVPHNLTFGPPIEAATSPLVQSGGSETLQFTAPDPGDYRFVCTLHPGMEGVLRVTE